MNTSAELAPLKWLAVAGLAAAPWGEEVIAIPAGVAMGLSPWQAGAVALPANLLPALAICAMFGRIRFLSRWDLPRPGRSRRAVHLFRKHGAPGLAFLAPLATGVYLATLAALLLGVPPRAWLLWLTASLTAWALTAAAVTHAGGTLLRFL